MPKFSLIVPVYNRPDEVLELIQSLEKQTVKHFELIIVEDGSDLPCEEICQKYEDKFVLKYFFKSNSGRSETRNYGMERATGDYFVFFDSDCILSPNYFENLEKNLSENYSDCFGGPDKAHESFSDVQKAINFAMTSFLTTGGIRGGKNQMEKFKPRTFNMGFSRAVYEKVGGFKNMFGEDIDLSIRIDDAGFRTTLYQDVFVYHKRRVSFKKFYKQVNNFGAGRINLAILHKNSLKLVHTAPAVLLVGLFVIILLSIFCSSLWLVLPAIYTLLLFADALIKTKKIKTAILSVWASFIQITAYGIGFLKSFFQKIVFCKGLESEEVLKKVYK